MYLLPIGCHFWEVETLTEVNQIKNVLLEAAASKSCNTIQHNICTSFSYGTRVEKVKYRVQIITAIIWLSVGIFTINLRLFERSSSCIFSLTISWNRPAQTFNVKGQNKFKHSVGIKHPVGIQRLLKYLSHMHWFQRNLTRVCQNSSVIVAKINIFHHQS